MGMNDYSEVREMDNEESSRSSSDVPEYNDYVMFDKAQRDKILQQFTQMRQNIGKVRQKVDSDIQLRHAGQCQFPKMKHKRKITKYY